MKDTHTSEHVQQMQGTTEIDRSAVATLTGPGALFADSMPPARAPMPAAAWDLVAGATLQPNVHHSATTPQPPAPSTMPFPHMPQDNALQA